jgi:heptosyltransferase-2
MKDTKIDILVTPWASDVIKNNPNINNIIKLNAFWMDPKTRGRRLPSVKSLLNTIVVLKRLIRLKYSVIINVWFDDSPITALFLGLIYNSYQVGFAFPLQNKIMDRSIEFNPSQHILSNLLQFTYLFESNIKETIDEKPYYYFSGKFIETTKLILWGLEKKRYIIISPFTSEKAKTWAPLLWNSLIKRINNSYPHLEIVLTGINNDRLEKEVIQKDTRITDLINRTTLDQFAYLISNACLVIATESSPIHFAGAFNTPCIALFSRIYDFRRFLCTSQWHREFFLEVDCANCLFGCDNPICMNHDVDLVWKETDRFLQTQENKLLK